MTELRENGIYLDLELEKGKPARLLNFSCRPWKKEREEKDKRWCPLVQIQASGFNQNDHHGNKHTGCSPSDLLTYTEHKDYRNEYGRKLEICQEWEGLLVITHIQFYDGITVISIKNEIKNQSAREFVLEYVSSLVFTGIEGEAGLDEGSFVWLPHNTWFGECQWRRYSLKDLGYRVLNPFTFSMKRIHAESSGSWACSEYLPMGCFYQEGRDESLLWQIETSGSWNWEISDIGGMLYIQTAGPSYQENGFLRRLRPGETFTGVACGVAVAPGEMEEGVRQLTQYRRKIRRKNPDNERLPVIFNDYMNCLGADPTEEKEKPLIDIAARMGCEYYCIDAGWYGDGSWWDCVGEWLPSEKRFPSGLQKTLDYIREKGMVPGLWLELEVMGIHCPLAAQLPDDWFFQRNGERVIDHGRFQLDFRNPQVREYAGNVVKRLVEEYKVGYIKMDYNINAGLGTEIGADSVGEGLLEHTRSYLAWLDEMFDAYPELVIENCSSGGMRMEYSLLSRQSIQSISDQEDYRKMTAIAANCATACAPEQAAVWSYPIAGRDSEETIYNMINTMLFRIHQSGRLDLLDEECLSYVKEGIACYKSLRGTVREGLPCFPTGLASMDDEYVSYGLKHEGKMYLAVWRTKGESRREFTIPLEKEGILPKEASCIYPSNRKTDVQIGEGKITVSLEPETARLFCIS